MEIPVQRVAGLSAAARAKPPRLAADKDSLLFAAGAGAVKAQVNSLGTLRDPLFFHCARKRLAAAAANRLPWDRPAGPAIIGDVPGEETSKIKAKDKVNGASCVAVAANSGCVAVGEMGYLPRVIVYSSEAVPLAIIQEHQFGVQHLQFSPNGHYLASLGTPEDGYLYIWEVDSDSGSVTMHSSNRCITTVHDLQWVSETQLATVGVRHIRVWTLDNAANSGRVLPGRNVILGECAGETFTSLIPIGGELAGLTGDPGSPGGISPFLVATQSGKVLRIGPGVHQVLQVDYDVVRMAIREGNLVLAGSKVEWFDLKSFDKVQVANNTPAELTPIVELAAGNPLVWISEHGAFLSDGTPLIDPLDRPVTGFQGGDQFVSWHNDELIYWTRDMDIDFTHTLPFNTAVVKTEPHFVCASAQGEVSIDGKATLAHSGPVTDVDCSQGLVVSCGRDRHLQIWTLEDEQEDGSDSWRLQSIPLLGPLSKARIIDSETVVTVSSAKTVQLHRMIDGDFQSIKTLPIKVQVHDLVVHEGKIILSTNDKQVLVFEGQGPQIGTQIGSYRTSDVQGEPVTLNHLAIYHDSDQMYLIASASDKSVAVYSHPQGHLLAAEWAHSGPIAGIAVAGSRIVSYGDAVVVRAIEAAKETLVRPASPVRSVRAASPVRKPIARPASPMRSPVRAASPLRQRPSSQSPQPAPPRSPSPVRTIPRSRLAGARPASPTNSKVKGSLSPVRLELSKLDLKPGVKTADKPLRLAEPAEPAEADQKPEEPVAVDGSPEDPVSALEKALQTFNAEETVDAAHLQPLLVKALSKVDGMALAETISLRILETVNNALDRSLDRAIGPQSHEAETATETATETARDCD